MYTARTLLRKVADVEVDVIEMLPTPYGLVRYGVAPDHADTKNVTAEFSQILSSSSVSKTGSKFVDRVDDPKALVASLRRNASSKSIFLRN